MVEGGGGSVGGGGGSGGGGGKKCIRLHNWGRYSEKRSLWIIIAARALAGVRV